MTLGLTDEQAALRRRARELAEQELRPYASQWDAAEEFPERSYQLFRTHGFTGLCTPAEFGGHNLGVFEACLVLEQMAYGCMASAMSLQLNLNGPGRVIANIGTAEQKARYLPGVADGSRLIAIAMTEPQAGSDGLALQTSLTPDGSGFRLNGAKCHITAGDRAESVLVFCRLAGTAGKYGIGAVIVERGIDGFVTVSVEPKMGGRGVGEAVLSFDNVRIESDQVLLAADAESKRGAEFLLVQFNPERCGNAAMCLGVAQAAFDYAVLHATERSQFGRPIGAFQGMQWKFADMAVDLEAARLLLWQAARSDVGGFPAIRETAMAKLYCNEAAIRVCNEAIQVLGHKGYLRDYPVERMFRDVRGMAIAGGTTEILRNMIGSEVTGIKTSQRELGSGS